MPLCYASVIVDISHENVDRAFQYRIPESLLSQIRIGTQVCVPFGSGNRLRKGYVVEILDHVTDGYEPSRIKELSGVVEKSVTADERLIRLAWWMKEHYGSTMNQALKTVLPVKRRVKARNRRVVESLVGADECMTETGTECRPAEPVILNEEQQAVADAFAADFAAGDRTPYLLHGVTGSGKTEVYMAMIDTVLAAGRQVIVLIPEIALTWQTVMRFYRRFGERICVMHSRLAAGERYDQFEKARQGKTDIMIGARSALFTPFPDPGLIIIDEEHEGAYVSEGTPKYHAREVAEELASMCGAALVLGSATPSVEAYAKSEAGIYKRFELTRRAGPSGALARVEVVDLREEILGGNKSIFSRRLQELIRDRLMKKEQIMLFMNRRGYRNFVSCRSCGTAIRCPHCDVSLTLHNKNRLVCHYCGYSVPLPKLCPECGSPYLAGFGVGTQKIEELTHEMFPEARLLRMDLDTTSHKGGHEEILSAFAHGGADILIGTQMIVKGHDFPGVTLVGILAADVSLYAPDYRSSERTFELLVQAAGRAGRGRTAGLAVIQTYAPEHYSIRAAAAQDYRGFYEKEMAFRRIMAYPPACRLLSIRIEGRDEALTAHMMDQVARSVERNFGNQVLVIGPVPAPVYKVKDIYRKILYLKHGKYDTMSASEPTCLHDWRAANVDHDSQNHDLLIRIQKYVQQRWDETEDCRRLTVTYSFE